MSRKSRAATLAEVLAFVATAPLPQVEVAVEALRTILLIRKATDGTPLQGVVTEGIASAIATAPKVIPPRKRAPKVPLPVVETPAVVGEE